MFDLEKNVFPCKPLKFVVKKEKYTSAQSLISHRNYIISKWNQNWQNIHKHPWKTYASTVGYEEGGLCAC